ncbi:zinc finger BED domain-containing protein RICESLEEPER 2-like [Cannabis sativa]|uniref:zinc finger BED domain-containing protein RICESLEEPER 2-like n=1 Tax=Cannabis sativa TaxID=3483 RepID=UPI0029CA6309|nr:zinc finger BED domain-containing protein RICESLEEPER 2-like [Cannabis sativa]
MIVLHEYPLNMVEHDGFRSFVKSLQPLFRYVSRTTIRRDILKIYENEKTKTMNSMNDNRSRVAITTDLWTSNNQKRGYMVVTAHYIDDSWILRNRIIRFIYVPTPHTAKLKVLMECLIEWSIERKLSTLTLDNRIVNIAMMDQMKEKLRNTSLLMKGKLLHMKCSAHILNLIVQQGLGAIQGAIKTIRESVVFWTGTPKRVEKFEEAKKGLSCSSNKRLVLDCKTRWNSTYLMLTSAITYKDVFSRLIHTEKNYKKEPSERDWLLAKVMCEKLKLFYNYWTSIHGILAIATVLDPRFKMKLIEYYFPKIYVGEYQNEVKRSRMLCYDLVKEYKSNDGKENILEPLFNASGVGGDNDGCVDDLVGFDLYVSSTSNVETYKSELDLYLEEAKLCLGVESLIF